MGIDYTVFLGPYVECITEKVDVQKSKRTCLNEKCSAHGKNVWDIGPRFCKDCGSEIGKFDFIEKENKVNTSDLTEKIKEHLVPVFGDAFHRWSVKNDIDLWLPNLHRVNKEARHFSFDPTEGIQLIDITREVMAEEITEFNDQYRNALDILRKHYGLEKVTVKWGLLNYAY